MKKIVFYLFTIIFIFSMSEVEILAHPGRTDKNGCHTCRTNCEKWGLSMGDYHCHNGSSSSSSGTRNNSSYSNINSTNNNVSNNNYVSKEVPKSSDNTLKSIVVDGNNIVVSDVMNYKTFNETVNVEVQTNDSKAKYTIENKTLNVGNNNIAIKVTAENGTEKIYTLSITREKLSDNTNIEVFVDNEEILFNNGKATINVSSDTDKLNYRYNLEDKYAKVKIDGDTKLKTGNNILSFKVTAQDGTTKLYELTIQKNTKTEEIASFITALLFIGAIIYLIYYFKKRANKKTLN